MVDLNDANFKAYAAEHLRLVQIFCDGAEKFIVQAEKDAALYDLMSAETTEQIASSRAMLIALLA